MFHNIQVMSKTSAEKYSRCEGIPRTIIVSIRDIGQPTPAFDSNPKIEGICFLEFADEETGPDAMTIDQASEILKFVEPWIDKPVDIVVHCAAGVSRSAGTAAALMLLVNGDDSPIFDSAKYSPNMNCYRNVLKAAGFEYDESLVDEKHRRQLELWMALAEENGLV